MASLYSSDIFDNQNTTSVPVNLTLNSDDVTPSNLQTTRFVVQTILTPLVGTVGLLGNILNILVLFQPNMRTSTNVYLCVLSLADSVYLMCNFALSLIDCRKPGMDHLAYYFNPYGRFASNFSGNVAVWVAVVFTVERYIAVCHPIRGKVWCTVSRAQLASVLVTVLVLVNTLPTLFELEVVMTEDGPECRYTELAKRLTYELVYTWWYVTVFTFIPLTFLTIFNIVLVRSLVIANRKREQMTLITSSYYSSATIQKENGQVTTYSTPTTSPRVTNKYEHPNQIRSPFTPRANHYQHHHGGHNNKNVVIQENALAVRGSNSDVSVISTQNSPFKRQSRRFAREQNKVTSLLVTIVMIFLLCQIPWTALFLYKTYLSSKMLPQTSTDIKIAGNICNLLGLINASVNFYLYSCFSRKFRRTLAQSIFFCKISQYSPTNI